MSTLLQVEDLKTWYQTRRGLNRAVDGVSLTLAEGQTMGLVGESGCGKTTLGRSLIRVLPRNARIHSGRMLFKGQDLVTLPESRMRRLRWTEISAVPQSAMDSLDPVYRLEDQMLEVLVGRGGLARERARQRARELFEMVGLEARRLRYYPHEFSGGMKQRAVIAMALALNPSLVIADEPVTALDVIVQHQVLRKMKELQAQFNLAVIMITHDVSVVAETCEQVAVMYAGRMVEVGPVAAVLKRPFHPYTLGLQNAFPNLAQPQDELVSIEGYPPDLTDPPKGCRFAERCPFAVEQCRNQEPPALEVEPGHLAACHRVDIVEEMRAKAREVTTWQRVATP